MYGSGAGCFCCGVTTTGTAAVQAAVAVTAATYTSAAQAAVVATAATNTVPVVRAVVTVAGTTSLLASPTPKASYRRTLALLPVVVPAVCYLPL